MKGFIIALVSALFAMSSVHAQHKSNPYQTKLGCMSCHSPQQDILKDKKTSKNLQLNKKHH